MTEKDRLYEEAVTDVPDFVFDERVVRVFPDMINRSVPGYALIVPMIGLLARCYALPGSNLYDLGCSLGAVTRAMRQAVHAADTRIHAVDDSEAMIAGLERLISGSGNGAGQPSVQTHAEDIRQTVIENASVVVLNFTLQFIEPEDRLPLLTRIARGMLPGGALILSEKVRFEDPLEQRLQTQWHHEFKRAQGYSELEIARKREALENVMKPDTRQQHLDRLEQAGFSRAFCWYQGFNFLSLIALK